ncbi:serine/threonine-protein kinase [Nocardia mexicana]|uniref:non-specific serine/threonine protein kinase n=1 Tax=Nocardia mexicana TaxID=279262 RepID=A0A370H3U3_9NOCA|nr:serine/threonine-protein kinase [Nocardia mexicana]RDI50869.1 serine/threonine-protein kinase [Nocardia mexicana]
MTGNPGPGALFAGYRLERVLGRGGMGTVFLAQHPRLPRRDAVKVLSDDRVGDEASCAGFVRGADLAARLDHPNVVAVHDRGVEHGRPWIAMQYVDGSDVGALLRRAPSGLPPRRAAHIVAEAARGLDAAHRAGLVHRGVKPADILVAPRHAGPDRVLVTDFGIAWAAVESGAPRAESGSSAVACAAPELFTGQPVDHRVDVYALGCVLFELLTGVEPYPRANSAAVVRAHIADPPPRPTAVRAGLPPHIDGVVARALAKQPDERYPSCGALADAAMVALSGRLPVPAGPAKRDRRAARWIAGGLVVATATAGGAVAATMRSPEVGVPAPAPTSAGPTASPTAPATGVVLTWGSHGVVAARFPGLLPATPADSGYQGIRCAAVDPAGRPMDLTAPAGSEMRVQCTGNHEPVDLLTVRCQIGGGGYEVPTEAEGSERWQRASGTGTVTWGTVRDRGAVVVRFETSPRNECGMVVTGGSSGQDLLERWWRGAPI